MGSPCGSLSEVVTGSITVVRSGWASMVGSGYWAWLREMGILVWLLARRDGFNGYRGVRARLGYWAGGRVEAMVNAKVMGSRL